MRRADPRSPTVAGIKEAGLRAAVDQTIRFEKTSSSELGDNRTRLSG